MTVKQNIFDYATSELSTSAFYAWLIAKLDVDSGASEQLREAAFKFVNMLLLTSKGLQIDSSQKWNTKIKTEFELPKVQLDEDQKTKPSKNKIDLYVVVSPRDNSKQKYHIFIENKVHANETKKNQLRLYDKGITSKKLNGEILKLYIKSGYDFEDPLKYKTTDGKLPSKGDFKKINWVDLFKFFQDYQNDKNDILKSYALKCCENYHIIDSTIIKSKTIQHGDLNNHVGQFHFLRQVFGLGDVHFTDGGFYYFESFLDQQGLSPKEIKYSSMQLESGNGKKTIRFRPNENWQDLGWYISDFKLIATVNTGYNVNDVHQREIEAKNQYDLFVKVLEESGLDKNGLIKPEYNSNKRNGKHGKQVHFCKISLKGITKYEDLFFLRQLSIDYLNKWAEHKKIDTGLH